MHLAIVLNEPEYLDPSTLSKTNLTALRVVGEFMKHNIPYKLLRAIREVKVWGEGDMVLGLEFKFTKNPAFKKDIDEIKDKLKGH